MELLSPEWLSPLSAILLIVLAGFSSFITAAFGAGGGLLLLVVMASVMPMAVVIPVHGLVQLGSNANRMLLTLRHIDWHMLVYFSAGAVPGAIGARFVVADLPLELMKLLLGLFVIYLLWGVRPIKGRSSRLWRVIAGGFTTFMSMFVGASGPLVGSFMHVEAYDKLRFTATFSTCMTLQHSLKALVYGTIGFAFWQWLPLIVAMIFSGAIGTWLGLSLLNKIPAARFKLVFRVILSLLCLQLIWQALGQWLAG